MIYGWDVSTAIVGTTVLQNDGSYVCSTYHDMRKMKVSLLDKVDDCDWYVREIVEKHSRQDEVDYHFVEDKLAGFTQGFSNATTKMQLAAFNLAFSYLIWREHRDVGKSKGVSLSHIHPSTCKAQMKQDGLIIPKGADKKELTLDFVKKIDGFPLILNKNGNPQPYCYDMADSYIIARSGWRKHKLDGSK